MLGGREVIASKEVAKFRMLVHGHLSSCYFLTAIVVSFIVIALTDGAVSTKKTEIKPTPADTAAFEFAYETKDEEGNLQMHREHQDVLGRRVGTYGYRHINGIYRFVDYVADRLGYRATIRTNEPGTGLTLGADVAVKTGPSPTVKKPRTGQTTEIPPKTVRRYASKAVVTPKDNSIAAQALSKRPHVPLPAIVVPSPITDSRLVAILPPSSRGSTIQSEPDEVPRVPEEPILDAVHAADVVQPPRRQSSRVSHPALLFPAPPLIRPPRYRTRAAKPLQQGLIEAAFRKRRS
ncbi:uncharacterized protein LOC111262661 isoform X2 [Varroa jacobsoni]|uniref:uncharacterized protein LOC111262661 isoform X2 n=1 Tax=Varroa jacobsoni TaxID=62625 RepID=UPI000BF5B2C4|nr:uncharacterized protein LOC111262661 isoform X2 [Varroa jacobsoni]